MILPLYNLLFFSAFVSFWGRRGKGIGIGFMYKL